MYNQNNGIRLDKKQLPKTLALGIAKEIKNNVPRQETKIEHEKRRYLRL
jgi:hypothetical protein